MRPTRSRLDELSNVGSILEVHPAGHELAGQYVTREATCESCVTVQIDADTGAILKTKPTTFTQFKLSLRFLTTARKQARETFRTPAIDRDMPDGWTPDACPRCARR